MDQTKFQKLLKPLTLVLGGASSGKSAYAERLFESVSETKTYIATAQAFDAEMTAKIEAHKISRGSGWTTVEAPLALGPALATVDPEGPVLLDCATLWLSNILLAERDVAEECAVLLKALRTCAVPVVVVSNEVGQGIVPENALARRFRTAQGSLNQQIAAEADCVVAIMAGLPLALKGDLP